MEIIQRTSNTEISEITEFETKKCEICDQDVDDEANLGKFIEYDKDLSVHFFCLLLSTNLLQNGEDEEGILGFRINDIVNFIDVIRSFKRTCYYCKKPNVGTRCGKKKCSKAFHIPCGIKNDCVNIFDREYKSYCHVHIPKTNKHNVIHETYDTCKICLMEMGTYNVVTSISTENCCKNGWFHISCVKKFALEAGENLCCPICNDTSFKDYVCQNGVFVPDRVTTSFLKETLLSHKVYCEAIICKSPYGRLFEDQDLFKMVNCNKCNKYGIHIKCTGIRLDECPDFQFECIHCANMLPLESQSNDNLNIPIENNLIDQSVDHLYIPAVDEVLYENNNFNISSDSIETLLNVETKSCLLCRVFISDELLHEFDCCKLGFFHLSCIKNYIDKLKHIKCPICDQTKIQEQAFSLGLQQNEINNEYVQPKSIEITQTFTKNTNINLDENIQHTKKQKISYEHGICDLTISDSELSPDDLFFEASQPTIYMPKPFIENRDISHL